MATALTKTVALSATAWTLIADGDAGATDTIVQLKAGSGALINMAGALPAAGVTDGIAINQGEAPFSCAIAAGQKLYGRSYGGAASVSAIVCGE